MSAAERGAQLKELEYQFETKLRDDLELSGTGYEFDKFMGKGRTADDILGTTLPEGYETGLGDMGPSAVPTGPSGQLSPFGGFMGGAQGGLPGGVTDRIMESLKTAGSRGRY